MRNSRLDQWQRSIRAELGSLEINGNMPDVNLPQAHELSLPQADFLEKDLPGPDLPQIPALVSTDFANLELGWSLST